MTFDDVLIKLMTFCTIIFVPEIGISFKDFIKKNISRSTYARYLAATIFRTITAIFRTLNGSKQFFSDVEDTKNGRSPI